MFVRAQREFSAIGAGAHDEQAPGASTSGGIRCFRSQLDPAESAAKGQRSRDCNVKLRIASDLSNHGAIFRDHIRVADDEHADAIIQRLSTVGIERLAMHSSRSARSAGRAMIYESHGTSAIDPLRPSTLAR